nr:hAT family C-terminal dimerization region domain containing protein [Pandoravirus belohorizontensis]
MRTEEGGDENSEEDEVTDLTEEKKPTKRNRKRTSEVWAHFGETEDGRECNHCGHLFSMTTATGTLMRHLKSEHDDTVEVRKEGVFEKKTADALVTKLITNKCLPLSLVDDEDFVELLGYLRPKYKPPKRRNLRRELPEAKAVLTAAMKKKIRTIDHFSLTLDAWTSAANRSYIAVTVHGVSTAWILESFVLDVVPVKCSETAEFLTEVVREVLQAWEIDMTRVVAITSDGAANMKAAVTKCLNIEWIYCVAHLLNRSVRLALESDQIEPVLRSAKAISKTFKASPAAKRMLANRQKALGLRVRTLKIDNKTRWGSAHRMFKRLLASRPAVSACLGALHGLRKPVPADLTSAQWSLVEQLAKVLEPFKKSTKFLSHQHLPTLGAAMPIVARAIDTHLAVAEGDDTVIAGFKQDMLVDLTGRWNILDGQASTTLLVAVYLDPRFKTFYFIRDARKREKRLERAAREVEGLVELPSHDRPNPRRLDASQESAQYAEAMEQLFGAEAVSVSTSTGDDYTELERYGRKPAAAVFLPRSGPDTHPRLLDPLLWWKQREAKYPRLAALARRYLSITSTSVPSERVFSKSGWIINKRRCTLSDESVSLLVFLSCNKGHQAS